MRHKQILVGASWNLSSITAFSIAFKPHFQFLAINLFKNPLPTPTNTVRVQSFSTDFLGGCLLVEVLRREAFDKVSKRSVLFHILFRCFVCVKYVDLSGSRP